jgi:hypothetical protein
MSKGRDSAGIAFSVLSGLTHNSKLLTGRSCAWASTIKVESLLGRYVEVEDRHVGLRGDGGESPATPVRCSAIQHNASATTSLNEATLPLRFIAMHR